MGTIIEDSQETKKKKKNVPKLEEPPSAGLGTRLLRRLSKRDRDGRSTHPEGHDNYAYEMEAPKSPWRYPHLMFRADSRKQKSVSFRNSHGRNQLELPGISGFGEFAKHLRRTDSKDSSCSSLSSAPQTGAHDLRPTLSGPSVAFHDHFNKFKRTDSESSGGSLASMGLSILSRGGSRKAGRNVGESGELLSRAMERGESASSFASSLASSRKDSGGSEGVARRGDEVAIVVSNRKDSLTNAVRRNSGGENTTPEW